MMPSLRLSALIATLLAASVANARVEGDCVDVYDTGSGNCNVNSSTIRFITFRVTS